jgi:hypothetical protein
MMKTVVRTPTERILKMSLCCYKTSYAKLPVKRNGIVKGVRSKREEAREADDKEK